MRVSDLQIATFEAVQLCGIKRVYSVAPLVRDPRVGRTITNFGFPRIWERYYRSRLSEFDPLPSLSLDYGNAFRWPEDVDQEKLSPRQRRYMTIARRYGQGRMIGTACYGPQGRSLFMGGAWEADTPPPDAVLLAFHQIGQTAFHRYCQMVKEVVDVPAMSNRELDVLRLMCKGWSNPEIAADLTISRSSVDAYIRRIFAKLEVKDRTAACVRAFSVGLLVSDEVDRLVWRARKYEPKLY